MLKKQTKQNKPAKEPMTNIHLPKLKKGEKLGIDLDKGTVTVIKPTQESWEDKWKRELYVKSGGGPGWFETDKAHKKCEQFIRTLLEAQKQEIIKEIAEYSGINDIQTKELIEIIKRLK